MAEIAELLRANLLDVFNERDAATRRAAIERTYLPEITLTDPDEAVVGYDALDVKAQVILDQAPGFVFTTDGDAHIVGELGYLGWNFGPEGAPPVVQGADVVLTRDGRIEKVYTMLFGTPPAQ